MIVVLPGLFLIFVTAITVYIIIRFTNTKYEKMITMLGTSVLAIMTIVFITETVSYYKV
ncbi:hypothetical protein AB1282_09285 [Gottfriedia sp. S16(2024)]|uniref:hypothetical protein n=1 Tax=Gottfriedia sp. S16(2024) TaxID=3162883 RepID=UPI003D202066